MATPLSVVTTGGGASDEKPVEGGPRGWSFFAAVVSLEDEEIKNVRVYVSFASS